MATLFRRFPFLTKLFADGGYQGPIFTKAAARAMPDLSVEIVKRSDGVSGFGQVLACVGGHRVTVSVSVRQPLGNT